MLATVAVTRSCRAPIVEVDPSSEVGFMQQADVQGHFCRASGIDCTMGFSFEP